MAAYTAFTLAITSWRTKFRREMNSADNHAAAKSVDSLLNFEAVKYFGNEKFETKQYDHYLQQYEVAGIKTAQSLGALNVGQNAVFSVALTGMMYLAVNGIVEGTNERFLPFFFSLLSIPFFSYLFCFSSSFLVLNRCIYGW